MDKFRIAIISFQDNGKPKNFEPAEKDTKNYTNILNFSANVFDFSFTTNEIELINDFDIDVNNIRKNVSFPIKSDTFSLKRPRDIEEVLLIYHGLVNSVDLIVAYNYAYNRNLVVSELLNNGIAPLIRKGTRTLCLMKYFKDKLKIKNKKYPTQFKFPTLDDIEKSLFLESNIKNNKDVVITVQEILLLLLKKNIVGENRRDFYEYLNKITDKLQ